MKNNIGTNRRGAQGVLAPPILQLAPSKNVRVYVSKTYFYTKKKKNQKTSCH
jgi:hypothetical protein